MSGPIVRSGPSDRYTKNWGSVFADKKTPTPKKKAATAMKKAAKKKKK